MYIAIPKYYYLYSEQLLETEEKGRFNDFTACEPLTKESGKPPGCIQYGQCEGVYSQHLHIIEDLRAVGKCFAQ